MADVTDRVEHQLTLWGHSEAALVQGVPQS